jgi:flavin-dependent dehydrogenase
MTRWDAVIVGGGLAGSAAAIQLAEAGRRVLLLEKTTAAHHKVCGEFLSYEAQDCLKALGIDLSALGAVAITQFQLAHQADTIVTTLPFQGMSVSRMVLDEALLNKAASCGVTVKRGAKVSDIVAAADGWDVQVAGEFYHADAVLLATGKRDLRSYARQHTARHDYIGFKMHWQLTSAATQELQGKTCIAWFDGGYAGLQLIEDGLANLCLVVTKRQFASLGKDWAALLAAICRQVAVLEFYLSAAVPCWPAPLAIYGIPYGYVNHNAPQKNFYHLGDQLAVIPSFSGDGMAIALHSAARVAEAIINNHHRYAGLRRELTPQIRLAAFLAKIVESSAGQTLTFALCRQFPGLLALAANWTRLAAYR